MKGRTMDLTWGPDFEAFASAARDMCSGHQEPTIPGSESRRHPGLWHTLVEMGWLGATGPDDPAAAQLASIAGVFVELGRALAVTPLLEALLAREALMLSDWSGREALSDAIADGGSLVIPVLDSELGADPLWSSGGTLHGTAFLVPFGEQADQFLVRVRHGGEDELWLVPADDGALELEFMPNLADRPLFAVSVEGVSTLSCARVATGESARRLVTRVNQRAAVLRAAEVYGAGCSLLEKTVTYAQERHQFGRPIGQFQAVQYLCTDIAINVHLISVLARQAARCLDQGDQADEAVAVLQLHTARTAQLMVHCAHEVHAGIGFMLESDLHLYTRAAKYWQFVMGRPECHVETVASALVDAVEGNRS